MLLRCALTVTAAAAMDLSLLSESEYGSKGGRCLDGSMSGSYYGAPPSGSSDLWVINLAGGGACYDKASCDSRAKSKLGSSNQWSKTKAGSGLLSDDEKKNPDFYMAHKVHVPYCTGDTHAGTVKQPTEEQWGYYFSGHLNFKFIMEQLFKTFPAAKQAKRVLLTGGSAGGAGTFSNCDFLQDQLVAAGSQAKVSCAPIAGWFFPGCTEDQADPELPPSNWDNWSQGHSGSIFASNFTYNLYQAAVHPECAKAHKGSEHTCGSVSAAYPFIKSPMYVMENQYDTNQLSSELGLPKPYTNPQEKSYIAYFGRAMRNSTQQVLTKPGDGLFLPSCLDHGGGLGDGKTQLQGHTAFQGLGDWFYGRQGVPRVLVDDCAMEDPGLPCNPTCDQVPSGGDCEATVKDLCESTLKDTSLCEQCAKAHRSELVQAGCTQKAVKDVCTGKAAEVVV